MGLSPGSEQPFRYLRLHNLNSWHLNHSGAATYRDNFVTSWKHSKQFSVLKIYLFHSKSVTLYRWVAGRAEFRNYLVSSLATLLSSTCADSASPTCAQWCGLRLFGTSEGSPHVNGHNSETKKAIWIWLMENCIASYGIAWHCIASYDILQYCMVLLASESGLYLARHLSSFKE